MRKRLSAAARRKKNAARQRVLRAFRDEHRLCRTCGLHAVVVSKRTGKPAKQCAKHLKGDAKRKSETRANVPLTWELVVGTRLRGGITGPAREPRIRELRWLD